MLKNLKKKQKKISPEEQKILQREKAAQQWIPLADIDDSLIVRKDNTLVGAIRVQPTNLELLSEREKKRKVEMLKEELSGIQEPFQIFCIGQPVDLNQYLEWLIRKAKAEQDFVRKQILKGFIEQASYLTATGEIMERRFYMLVSKKNNNAKAKDDLKQSLHELVIKLQRAELVAKICDNDEIIKILALFASPIQAAFERTEYSIVELPPVLEY